MAQRIKVTFENGADRMSISFEGDAVMLNDGKGREAKLRGPIASRIAKLVRDLVLICGIEQIVADRAAG